MSELPWKHPARAESLLRALSERILVIDGAMGTMIQQHALDEAGYRGARFANAPAEVHFAEGEAHRHAPGEECAGQDAQVPRRAGCPGGAPGEVKGNNDLLTLSRPELIRAIHEAYLAAGADLLETNTFNSTRVSQSDYRLEHLVPELNREAARLARECCDAAEARDPSKPRFAVGVLGPTIAHRFDQPGRQRSGLPQYQLRRTARRLPRARRGRWSRAAPTRSWSRPCSTRSTPRRRCSRWRCCSRNWARACR